MDDDLPNGHRHREQSMPLLVGLLDSSVARQSLDRPVPLSSPGSLESVDLESILAKTTTGGGLLDSIANMANSILGAGSCPIPRLPPVILSISEQASLVSTYLIPDIQKVYSRQGLPYAVSQAGFVTGLILLIILCGITDWTIRLIVINAKLSGRHTYIDIMDHCFGSSGRAAVSFFQFAFAFGGMCAFGIIIGDTIPHVILSVFPSLPNHPFLKLFANRQFIISLCTICVSYPLSLYRDIHKLSRASGLALIGMIIIVVSVLVEAPQVPPRLKGDPSKRFSIIEPGVFQAIGVISFAFGM